MSTEELRMRLLEIAKGLKGEDRDAVERTEVELDAAFIELSRCRDRIKRLEDAGDVLADRLTNRYLIAHWKSAKEAKP